MPEDQAIKDSHCLTKSNVLFWLPRIPGTLCTGLHEDKQLHT